MDEDEYPPTPTSRQEDILLEVSSRGDVARMEQLVQQKEMQLAALVPRPRRYDEDLEETLPYLVYMVQTAAKAGQSLMVEFLIKFGKQHDIEVQTLVNRDCIHKGLRSGDVETVRTIFEAIPEVDSYESYYLGHGAKPLDRTVAYSMDRDPSQRTNKYLPMIAFLLENGAKPKNSNNPLGCPLQSAAGQSSLDIVELLLKYADSIEGTGAYHSAAKYNRIDVLEVLLAYGADINEHFGPEAGGYFGDMAAPLHVAARNKSSDAVKWLLSHGAELDSKDAEGKTPAEVEADEGRRDIMYFLNSSGGGSGGSSK